MSNAQRTVLERSLITLDEVYVSPYQKKNSKTARVRQTVVVHSFYPAMKAGNSLSKTLFAQEEFGATEQEFTSPPQQRVAFLNVPESATEEQILEHLKKANELGSVIYEIRSSKPKLTDEQKQAIQRGITTMDIIAEKQAMRYGDDTKIEMIPGDPSSEKDVSGQLVLDSNGKIQFRTTYFWDEEKADIDERTADPADTYLSADLRAELNQGVVTAIIAETPAAEAVNADAMQTA